MFWFKRVLKNHIVQTPLPEAGLPITTTRRMNFQQIQRLGRTRLLVMICHLRTTYWLFYTLDDKSTQRHSMALHTYANAFSFTKRLSTTEEQH